MVVRISNLLPVDDNTRQVESGTDLEIQALTMSIGAYQAINFTAIPQAVEFSTRSGTNDVSFALTNAPGNVYKTIEAGKTLSIDIASSGPYYFAVSSAGSPTVVGVALL